MLRASYSCLRIFVPGFARFLAVFVKSAPNESESGREFKLFERASELMKAHESLRLNESES